MNDKKRSKQIAKFMRFFIAGVLAFAVITGFSFSALAAQPLDWEAYAHSDKYYVRIERRYPEDERYEEFSTGEYIQRGCIRYAAYDAETGKEVVSQDLWYRMDQAKMYEIIPYEAAFPDIHVDRYGERYEENDVNVPGEGDSSVVFFDPWPLADGGYSQSDATQNSCSWSIEYICGIDGIYYLMENQYPNQPEKYYDEAEILNDIRGEVDEAISEKKFASIRQSDHPQIKVNNDEYGAADGTVIGKYASFTDDGYSSRTRTDEHVEVFDGLYVIPRKLPDVPLVLFRCNADYYGRMDRIKSRTQGMIERPEADAAMETFQSLRKRIEENVVQDTANAEIVHEWQEPVWSEAESETLAEDSFRESETEQYAESRAGEDSGAEIGSDIVETAAPQGKPQMSSDSGDNKTSFPKAIGIAVGGVILGAGAAGALGGNDGGGNSGGSQDSPSRETADDEKKRYKMFISKDFGDAVKKGAAPVTVRARIVEISTKSGLQKPRPDLTERITASGEGLRTGSVTLDGMWLNVQVYADEESPAKEGTVVFTFNGEGGRFHNRIVFRLVGKPYIVFPDIEPGSSNMVQKMIAEDENPYAVRFFFEDAVGEPEKILLDTGGRFRAKVREAETVRTYYADVIQNPGAVSRAVYAAPERAWIGIHAEFANGDIAEGGFYAEIWPEGLSVSSRHVQNDRLMIDTVANPEAGDLDYVIRPTGFEVRLAYRDAGGRPVFLTGEDLETRFSRFYETEKYGNTFTENFRCTVDTKFDEYMFEPQDTLPMLKDPYAVMVDMECAAGGLVYRKALPLGFLGEKPLLPSSAKWEEVYKKLRRDVEVFGVGNDPEVKAMIREARTMSAGDLEYVRYWIILCGKHFYETQSREYAEIDRVMTNYIVVGSALVKIGDKAVEVAIKLKWPHADAALVAAFVNPWKNAMAEFIGQYVARFSYVDLAEGNPEDFEFIRTMILSCESTLSEVITGTGDRPVDPKVMGRIVSLYLMISFAKHYFYGTGNEKGDIFKSTVEALKDLSLTTLKSFFTTLLKNGGKKLGKLAEFAGQYLGKTLKYVGLKNADLIAKNVFELQMRMAYAKDGTVSNAAYDAAKALKEGMKGQYLDGIGKGISEYTEGTLKWTAEYAVAGILNYLAKGTKKENECLGITTPEVLVEWTTDRSEELLKLLSEVLREIFGLNIMKYYKAAGAAMDISVKLNGEFLIMSFYGYTVEINIIENAEALMGIAYEACFGWMEDLWKSMQSNDPSWDPRDDLSDDTTMVERMTEKVRNLGSSADITYKDASNK